MSAKKENKTEVDQYEKGVEDCKKFFSNLKKHHPSQVSANPGKECDISGLSAIEVIAVMAEIINDDQKWTNSNHFLFSIKRSGGPKYVFKLYPGPTNRQPGNAKISMKSSNGDEKPYTYPQLLEKLQKESVTCQQFGIAIKSLFN